MKRTTKSCVIMPHEIWNIKNLMFVTDISHGASSELAISNNCCITSVPKNMKIFISKKFQTMKK